MNTVHHPADGQSTSESITPNITELFVMPEKLQMVQASPEHCEDALFRLMDLPRELRDLIFWHTVTIDTFTIQDANLFDLIGYDAAESDQMIRARRQCLDAYRALARVDRQMHGEVEGVFFGANRFEFWLIDVHVAVRLGEWLHRVHHSFIARMRKIRIVQALQAFDGWVDITLLKDDRLFELRENGESSMECVERNTADRYFRSCSTPGNAHTAAKRRMGRHARSYRKQLKLQDPSLPRPYVNHVIDQERGRTRERFPPPEFSFTPEVLRRMMCDVIHEGALELPIGLQRVGCGPSRGCVSPENCSCDECYDSRCGKTRDYPVSEKSRRRGANGEGSPFVADWSYNWQYCKSDRKYRWCSIY